MRQRQSPDRQARLRIRPALLLAVALASPWPAPVAAQEPAPPRPTTLSTPLTLDEALARGLANSQRLAELQAREAAAAAVVDERSAAALPSIALTGGYTRTNHVPEFSILVPGSGLQVVYPDIPDNVRTRVDVQWPIYTAGRTDALERAARAERQAAGQDLEAARADLRLEITRAFWALVTAGEAERVVAHALETIDAHIRDLRVQLEQGFIPPNDVLTAEAQRARQQLLSIEAVTTRGVAQADLARLIDEAEPGTLVVSTALSVGPPPEDAAAALVAQARAARPELRALDERTAAARARQDAARAGSLPQIALAGGYDYARPNPRFFPRAGEWADSWDVSVNVGWTVWDGGRNRAERAEAAALTSVAEARAREADRQVTFEVRQRRLEVESSRAAIATAEAGVRAAEEAQRVVGNRFRAGVATNTDVLDAESDLLQAGLDRTRALANARLADARLRRAVGQ